jgi:hypothetical protein
MCSTLECLRVKPQHIARDGRRPTAEDRARRHKPILYTRPSSCTTVSGSSVPSVRVTSRRIPPLSSCQSAQSGHRSMNNVRFDGEVLSAVVRLTARGGRTPARYAFIRHRLRRRPRGCICPSFVTRHRSPAVSFVALRTLSSRRRRAATPAGSVGEGGSCGVHGHTEIHGCTLRQRASGARRLPIGVYHNDLSRRATDAAFSLKDAPVNCEKDPRGVRTIARLCRYIYKAL